MNEQELKQLLKLAYLDIKYLVAEGFDMDVKDWELEGVKDTIQEIEEVIGKENLTEEAIKEKFDA
tara:strand:+ start:2137 stop:2331 length:195 start_codon:yes stop_codon:yes gene_type:complete